MLSALTIAGATAIAAVGGYAVYRGASVFGTSAPTTQGALTAAALFLWAALTLPIAVTVLTGGIVLAVTLLPFAVLAAGSYLFVRRWQQWRDPDVITVN